MVASFSVSSENSYFSSFEIVVACKIRKYYLQYKFFIRILNATIVLLIGIGRIKMSDEPKKEEIIEIEEFTKKGEKIPKCKKFPELGIKTKLDMLSMLIICLVRNFRTSKQNAYSTVCTLSKIAWRSY